MERPSTPNTVIYDNELIEKKISSMHSRPTSGRSLALPPPPMSYKSPLPDKSEDAHSVGGGRIWTIEGNLVLKLNKKCSKEKTFYQKEIKSKRNFEKV